MAKCAFLVFLYALAACWAVADTPKAGIYSAEKDEVTGDMALSKRGGNFQVEGKIMFKRASTTIKGTLFSSNWKFKGTLSSKDKSGKMVERPVNGNWNHRSNSLTMYFPGGYLDFTRDGATSEGKEPDFGGTWSTDFGKMNLTQSGKKVNGKYDYYGGKIDGEIRGDGKLYFEWSQTNNRHGKGVFTLGSGGASFSGNWDYTLSDGKPANNGGGWNGKRIK